MIAEPATSLVVLAVTTGLLHTVAGPDHYLPFVALARARSWSTRRTAVITLLCGVGHVLGSVLLGAIGISIGVAIFHLESIEAMRGEVAAWLMLAFGLVYATWGARRAMRDREHDHSHSHADEKIHRHHHDHHAEHAHVHAREGEPGSITPWVLFTIFVFGPCEVLIPQLMVPAATGNVRLLVTVVLVFGLTTIATMTGIVLALTVGLRRFELRGLRRHTHTLAGVAVAACGALILAGF